LQTSRQLIEEHGIALPARTRMLRYSGLSPEGLQLGRFLAALASPIHGHGAAPPLCLPENDLVREDDLVASFRCAIDAARGSDPAAHRPQREHYARLLRQLEDFIDGNLSSEIRIGDLCAQIGTSQRTLQYLFDDYYGMCPRRYLTVRRLNAVREELLKPGTGHECVAAVAGRFGFRHAGRFSRNYRELFGELPSRTRAGVIRPR
jgi:AraC-like DNA-binding protein